MKLTEEEKRLIQARRAAALDKAAELKNARKYLSTLPDDEAVAMAGSHERWVAFAAHRDGCRSCDDEGLCPVGNKLHEAWFFKRAY